MKRLLIIFATGVAVACLPAAASAGAARSATVPITCSSVSVNAPAGAAVESVTTVRREGGTVTIPPVPPLTDVVEIPDVPAYCDVTVMLTHPGVGDHAKVRVWLPETGWTGRFQALGGSAFAAGDYGAGLAGAIKSGYAAATTDAGVGTYLDTGWALNGDGEVDTELLNNFADRSQHEMAVVGKQVVDEVYGRPVSYSYWNGCSTGGRQGYMEAQRHPDDFDGILATAPAINWDEFEVATLWPQVVMNEENTFPSPCEFNAFNEAAVKACDPLDGAPDGLIGDPATCTFDPRKLIGKSVECYGEQETITAADAAVVRKIWDGPRTPAGKKLWAGIPIGAGFDLAGTRIDADGTRVGVPFPVPATWVSTFLKRRPSYDLSTITYAEFAELFAQSQAEYDTIIGTDAPDLSAFRRSGGKLLTWHGQADQLIPAQGTVDYRRRVELAMGGARRVDDFYRLFLAPGVAHCAGDTSTGPKPTDALGALTAWVEQGRAPQTLSAAVTDSSGETVTRELCRYPSVSRYIGHGDPADARSYSCAPVRH
ncbi:tannase/feruloyl esterase family alpha/beta hydrolase [Microbispora sp. NEAU-D428]|uniref:tannase/feruloyl esterase family alpha/beta hydrolase n=1 Tax=Microbispora sitophila TaxID=2771537 RepID=UPI00186899C0|nr:tannase/feruloyl esterase family alpha/beta hydrolase [Microbispora sitophila]MBE3012589.1 tannase/feruloyl esterase family alpha/beta hydrolase [Microbispora sitophila]